MTNLDNLKYFGIRLQEALGGGSYKEITERLDVNGLKIDYENVRRYILGERRPDYETLVQLSAVANVSIHWLLTGKEWNKNEAQDGSNNTELWRNPVWNQFTLDELNALKALADYYQKSLENTLRLLAIEGLRLRDFLSNPISLPVYSISSFEPSLLCPIDIWGEIGAENHFTVKNEVTNVPVDLRPAGHVNESGWIHPTKFHGFRVVTEQLSSQGIQGGDLIVCSKLFSIYTWSNLSHNSRPFLIPQEGNSKMFLRRVYRDVINENKFVFRPIRDFQPVERFKVKASELEYIFGIVTE